MISEFYEDSYSLMGVMFPELREIFCEQKPNLPDNFVVASVQGTSR
jgi:hypothetical protein